MYRMDLYMIPVNLVFLKAEVPILAARPGHGSVFSRQTATPWKNAIRFDR